MMESTEQRLTERVTTKPRRSAIVRFIGEKGEVSFKELKAKMGVGVGTLYYHLDGLADVVTQNKTRQYILTEQGRRIYESIKDVEVANVKPNNRRLFSRISATLREVFFFESHIERLSTDSMSNLSLTVAILVVGAVLAALTRIEPAIFFVANRTAAPDFASSVFIFSWLVVFAVSWVISFTLWRGKNVAGVAAGSALSFIPITSMIMLDAVRRTFSLGFLGPLFTNPGFIILQIALVLWASYILTISLMSASNLSLERALVVAFSVVLINLGYLWARPFILPH